MYQEINILYKASFSSPDPPSVNQGGGGGILGNILKKKKKKRKFEYAILCGLLKIIEIYRHHDMQQINKNMNTKAGKKMGRLTSTT